MPATPVPERLSRFLSLPNRCVVATLRADGSPHTAATWYTWTERQALLLNMDVSRVRLKHLRRDPRVALTIFSADDWYSHVSLSGSVAEIRHDADLADIDEMSMRYDQRPYADRDRDRWTAVVAIDRWHAWGSLGDNG
jgi:PPOX class probable F420-dependent enzyme